MDWERDPEWLLSHVMKRPRLELLLDGSSKMNPTQQEEYRTLLTRRAEGEPLQYIIGSQDFMGLCFLVDHRVLIPRQDTEILVEESIEVLKSLHRTEAQVLDIGSGSGAIGISIAKFVPSCQVVAVDINEGALALSLENAKRNGVEQQMYFLQSDLTDGLSAKDHDRFDVIVSNPPYIPSSDIAHLQREIRDHEPIGALDGGEDGLALYRRMAQSIPSFLKTDGTILWEIGYNQAIAVCQLLLMDFYDIRVLKDLAGMDRIVTARKR